MRRISKLVLAAALLAAALPLAGAQAHHCDTANTLVIFSYVHRAASLNLNGTGCSVDPDDEIDLRLVYPGAIATSVRYIGPVPTGTTELTATLNGLGFVDYQVTLAKIVDETLGSVTWDSEILTLPGGRATIDGVITTTVDVPTIGTFTTCAHTVDLTTC